VVGIAESVAAAVRRRQRDREPRVLLIAPTGTAHSVAPSAPGYDQLLGVAERILERAAGDPVPTSIEPGDEDPGSRAGGARP
jgi:hypothetical protein